MFLFRGMEKRGLSGPGGQCPDRDLVVKFVVNDFEP